MNFKITFLDGKYTNDFAESFASIGLKWHHLNKTIKSIEVV